MRRLVILKYHNIAREAILSGVTVDEALAKFMDLLLSLTDEFRICSLRDAMQTGSDDKRSPLVLSFDDSYLWYSDSMAPALAAHGIRATFFISSGNLTSGDLMWNDRVLLRLYKNPYADARLTSKIFGFPCYSSAGRNDEYSHIEHLVGKLKYLPSDRRDQIVAELCESIPQSNSPVARALEEVVQPIDSAGCKRLVRHGMEVGGHTVSHAILTNEEPAHAKFQVERDRNDLSAVIGEALVSFAYPNGRAGLDYGEAHVADVQSAGYRYAVTTDYGISKPVGEELYRLKRFEIPWHQSRAKKLRLHLKARYGNASD